MGSADLVRVLYLYIDTIDSLSTKSLYKESVESRPSLELASGIREL